MGKQYNLFAHHLQTLERWQLPAGTTYGEATSHGIRVTSAMLGLLPQIDPNNVDVGNITAPALLNTGWEALKGRKRQFTPIHMRDVIAATSPSPENQDKDRRVRVQPTKDALIDTARWRLDRSWEPALHISDAMFYEVDKDERARREKHGKSLVIGAGMLGLAFYQAGAAGLEPDHQHALALDAIQVVAANARDGHPKLMHGIPPTIAQLSSPGSPLSGYIHDQIQGSTREILVEAQLIASRPAVLAA